MLSRTHSAQEDENGARVGLLSNLQPFVVWKKSS